MAEQKLRRFQTSDGDHGSGCDGALDLARERIAALEAERDAMRVRLEVTSHKYHDSNFHPGAWEACGLSCLVDRAALKEAP